MSYFGASGGSDFLRQHLVGQLNSLEADVRRLREAMASPDGAPEWFIDKVRNVAGHLGDGLDQRLRDEFGYRASTLAADALALALQAEIDNLRAALLDPTPEVFKSARGAANAIEEIDATIARLQHLQAFDGQLAEAARRGKEHAARYRWRKKRDDAEVAEAGGNVKKAAKLRAEAAVMLRQDWVVAFPGEQPPA
ncbi:MAG TPA: hypothetical protein VFD43_12385 [Planctomycetota bacterium]|nr:hypothetical protein [Planctomycetota bacterium]